MFRAAMAAAMLAGLAACGMTPIRGEQGTAYEPSGGTRAIASRAAELAASMVGRPYSYGGQSPASGFDCSGLVLYSYRRAGLKVPRETGEQLRYGRRIGASDLVRGDLIFFDQEGKRASHVAVYLGDGRFVHAPSTGKSVRIDSLESAYWRRHVADMRRYVD
jgi:cell wall-associated NlpC family hydrolase